MRSGDKHTVPFHEHDKIWNNIDYENSGCKVFIETFLKWNSDIIIELDHHKKEPRKFLNFLLSKYFIN